MKTLVIIDIDGVLVDHTGRDHLIPADMRLNSNWIPHQAAIHADEPIIKDIDCQVGNVIAFAPGKVSSVYLTSRLEIARSATIKQLQRTATYNVAPLTTSPLEMRGMQDHREPARFKADTVIHLVHTYKPDQVILIDDTAPNLKAMIEAVRTFRAPQVRAYQPVGDILKQWPHEAAQVAAKATEAVEATKATIEVLTPWIKSVVRDVKLRLLESLDSDYPQNLIKQMITEELDNYKPSMTLNMPHFSTAIMAGGQPWNADAIAALQEDRERFRQLLAKQVELTAALSDMPANPSTTVTKSRLMAEQRARAIEDAIQNADDWVGGHYVGESALREFADKIRRGEA